MKPNGPSIGQQRAGNTESAGKQTRNVGLFEEASSAFNRRPERNIASYIPGLVQYGFYILSKCVLNYKPVMVHCI